MCFPYVMQSTKVKAYEGNKDKELKQETLGAKRKTKQKKWHLGTRKSILSRDVVQGDNNPCVTNLYRVTYPLIKSITVI